jgi:hypothetical protein
VRRLLQLPFGKPLSDQRMKMKPAFKDIGEWLKLIDLEINTCHNDRRKGWCLLMMQYPVCAEEIPHQTLVCRWCGNQFSGANF